MTARGAIKAVGEIWTSYYSGLRHLFHRSYTLRFPEQRPVVDRGFRGRHLLHLDRCTGCGICAWICPEKCITIVPRGERWYPQYFYGRCCFCHFCVTPDTLVTTNPSVKPIGEVKVDDRVLTHNGVFRKVQRVYRRNYAGRLYSIRPMGTPFPLRVTSDHPLLASTRKPIEGKRRLIKPPRTPEWKTPAELREGDYLTIPIAKETRTIESYEPTEVGEPATRGPIGRRLRLMTDPGFFRLVGYYLAEGYVVKGSVGFIFDEHEKEYISDASKLLAHHFNHIAKKQSMNQSIHLLLHSTTAGQFFRMFGSGREDKMLPDWAMYAPVEKQIELIKGVWRGDGKFHHPTKDASSSFFEYATTSQVLAFQLQQLLFRAGIVGQLFHTSNRDRKPCYVLTVRGRFVKKMAVLMGIEFQDRRSRTSSRFEMDENFVYLPIRRITSVEVENQPVVNLSVEGDESYVAGNVTAHNCTDYCPEYALEETVEYDLAEYTRDRILWSPERLARPPAARDDKYVFSVETSRGASNISIGSESPKTEKKK